MDVISLHIPSLYLKKLEELVSKNLFPNRSEAIRIAVRDLIKDEFYRLEKERREEIERKIIKVSP